MISLSFGSLELGSSFSFDSTPVFSGVDQQVSIASQIFDFSQDFEN